jgi:hypothetical protein
VFVEMQPKQIEELRHAAGISKLDYKIHEEIKDIKKLIRQEDGEGRGNNLKTLMQGGDMNQFTAEQIDEMFEENLFGQDGSDSDDIWGEDDNLSYGSNN